jgi:hypothetical protein
MPRDMKVLAPRSDRTLLCDHHFGLVAFVDTVRVLPLIIPVDYVWADDAWCFVPISAASWGPLLLARRSRSRSMALTASAASAEVWWSAGMPERPPTRPESLRSTSCRWWPGLRGNSGTT